MKVRIGGIDYSIVMSFGLRSEDDGQEIAGIIDHEIATIGLDAAMASPVMVKTLWHELFHAIVHTTGSMSQ